MSDNPFYVNKKTGFSITLENITMEPSIYQPTPMGIAELCDHYSKKYSIDLISIDFSKILESGSNALNFFKYLQQNESFINVNDGEARGIILSHGSFHAIPVLIYKKNDIQSMVVFDSTSGCRIKGYYNMANLFPSFQFFLNAGTRQADEGSCITDAICILKEALMIKDLIDILQNKICHTAPSFVSTSPWQLPEPLNFRLFYMPEKLLLTAQSSKYVTDAGADLSVIVRGGHSLGFYRDTYTMNVTLAKNEPGTQLNINSYLYLKSNEHKKILDTRWEFKKRASVENEFLDEPSTPRNCFAPIHSPSPIAYSR